MSELIPSLSCKVLLKKDRPCFTQLGIIFGQTLHQVWHQALLPQSSVFMSGLPVMNPNKNYEEAWETIEDDKQEFETAAITQQQQAKDPSEQEKQPQLAENVEHKSYEIVIESPVLKVPQKAVFDVDDDTDDEVTENLNKEAGRRQF
ncbi:hypothetical protein QQ045_033548 [Rhodiola kirilowii]